MAPLPPEYQPGKGNSVEPKVKPAEESAEQPVIASDSIQDSPELERELRRQGNYSPIQIELMGSPQK